MENKKETVAIYFLSDTGPVNAAGILGESVAALNVWLSSERFQRGTMEARMTPDI